MDMLGKNEQGNHQESFVSRRLFLQLTGSTALLAAGGKLIQAGRAWPADTGKTIRMGVVGGGFGASFHWHRHPNCVVTGVTDLRADRRERLRKKYKCDNVYDSLEEMIKKARDIDAVAIFSGGAGSCQTCQDVHGAGVACGFGGSGVHDHGRGGAIERNKGKNRTEIHDGGIELLPSGLYPGSEYVSAGRFR